MYYVYPVECILPLRNNCKCVLFNILNVALFISTLARLQASSSLPLRHIATNICMLLSIIWAVKKEYVSHHLCARKMTLLLMAAAQTEISVCVCVSVLWLHVYIVCKWAETRCHNYSMKGVMNVTLVLSVCSTHWKQCVFEMWPVGDFACLQLSYPSYYFVLRRLLLKAY